MDYGLCYLNMNIRLCIKEVYGFLRYKMKQIKTKYWCCVIFNKWRMACCKYMKIFSHNNCIFMLLCVVPYLGGLNSFIPLWFNIPSREKRNYDLTKRVLT